eukprot:1194763-Prorocentrum_minimum.AAC.9
MMMGARTNTPPPITRPAAQKDEIHAALSRIHAAIRGIHAKMRRIHASISIVRVTTAARKSGLCLEGVWRGSGGCLEGVWKEVRRGSECECMLSRTTTERNLNLEFREKIYFHAGDGQRYFPMHARATDSCHTRLTAGSPLRTDLLGS